MARRGPAYPVTKEWKDAVRGRMRELGYDQKALARRVRCAQSTLAEMLAEEAVQSSIVPRIHAALGWPPPGLPIASPDAGEMAYLFPRLPEDIREAMLAQARAILKRTG